MIGLGESEGVELVQEWLLLHYKIPREPTSRRVYTWRKLKRMGALLLHDAIWILPSNARTLEQFQWLVAEISELEGEALLWKSNLAMKGQPEQNLRQQFLDQVDSEYHEILAELAQASGKQDAEDNPKLDLQTLSKRYQQISQVDYFHSELGRQVKEALLAYSKVGEIEL